MSDNQKHEQRRFAIEGIKNTGFYYTKSLVDGKYKLPIINKGEITGAVDIDDMYEFASSHCTDFKDLRDDEDIVINREWILNKLAEAENE